MVLLMNEEWSVEFKPSAFKELKKLDHKIQAQVFNFLDKLTKNYSSPRAIRLQLQGNHKGLWRYRIGDYRLICEIQDHKLMILVLSMGHRKDVYDKR